MREQLVAFSAAGLVMLDGDSDPGGCDQRRLYDLSDGHNSCGFTDRAASYGGGKDVGEHSCSAHVQGAHPGTLGITCPSSEANNLEINDVRTHLPPPDFYRLKL